MTTPAGWYPDPVQPTNQRYWDGQQWTDHTNPLAAGVPMRSFGRSAEDVARVVEAVMWRHSKTNPLAAKSGCTGGEVSCTFSMDAEAFTRHQARAVVDEVLVHELDSFVQQTHLAAQTLEQIAAMGGSAAKNEGPWMSKISPLLTPGTNPDTGGSLHWWSSRLLGWLVFLVVGALFLAGSLKSCSA